MNGIAKVIFALLLAGAVGFELFPLPSVITDGSTMIAVVGDERHQLLFRIILVVFWLVCSGLSFSVLQPCMERPLRLMLALICGLMLVSLLQNHFFGCCSWGSDDFIRSILAADSNRFLDSADHDILFAFFSIWWFSAACSVRFFRGASIFFDRFFSGMALSFRRRGAFHAALFGFRNTLGNRHRNWIVAALDGDRFSFQPNFQRAHAVVFEAGAWIVAFFRLNSLFLWDVASDILIVIL